MARSPKPNVLEDKSSETHRFTMKSLFRRTSLDDSVAEYSYTGQGTQDDPYIIDWLPNDRQNPMTFTKGRKWSVALPQALTFFAVTFGSSVYASGILQVIIKFHVSEEVATLGLALYVLGFALGPIVWSPMSEVYGRRLTFLVSYTIYVAFTIAAPFSPNITALLILRFFAGAFGASTQTNPGAMIADMFRMEERGPVMAIFAACPFLGPALGPVVGGFIAASAGLKWLLGVNAMLSGVIWIVALITVKETYPPVTLQSRAQALSRKTRKICVSRPNVGRPTKTLPQEMSIAFTRPWILLFRDPIVLLTALYISIIYATLYLFFGAIPIVFEQTRGWSQGLAGLPFIGVAIGICFSLVGVGLTNKSYVRQAEAASAAGRVIEPEARLRSAMIGSIILPIGLFLFAWTTYPSIHWIAPIIGATIFSCGLVMVFVSLISYLVDAYALYASSALAANTILRSFFATAFPLFTAQMYAALGDQWASSIPAFLVLACVPVPFLFNRYGKRIRSNRRSIVERASNMDTNDQEHENDLDHVCEPEEKA